MLLLLQKLATAYVAAVGWRTLPYLELGLEPCTCVKGFTAQQSLTAEASATLGLSNVQGARPGRNPGRNLTGKDVTYTVGAPRVRTQPDLGPAALWSGAMYLARTFTEEPRATIPCNVQRWQESSEPRTRHSTQQLCKPSHDEKTSLNLLNTSLTGAAQG